MGQLADNYADSVHSMQHRFALYRKVGNEFSDALFYHSDHSDQRQEKTDRMPELQSAV